MATTMSVSTKPWSDYTAADYTVQQWHNACLIHNHKGPPTSKDQCKLPVKTPNGTVNKNGVYAAAGAIAGARGGVRAGLDQKKIAVKALLSYYSKMGEKPPDSLATFIHDGMRRSVIVGEDFLSHHGVKGQKWGIINKSRNRVTKGKQSNKLPPGRTYLSPDHRQAARLRQRPVSNLSNQELKTLTDRQTLEQRHAQLNPNKRQKGAKRAQQLLKVMGGIAAVGAFYNSPPGKAMVSAGTKFMKKRTGG